MPFARLKERSVYFERHGSGEPVLLVSGLGADHSAWQPEVAALQSSFEVVVFDNPGVGQTTGPDGPFTSELLADVAVELLDHLGLERAHVVGASMGGIIAQQIALRHPSRVRALALHCTWPRADGYLTALFRSLQACAAVLSPLELSRQIWLFVYTYGFFERTRDELEAAVLSNPHPQSARGFCDQAEACITHDVLDRLGEIRSPTLITVGEADLLAPPYHSLAIKERLPRALLHTWPRMGHAPFWEIPDEFNELNRCFLEAN